MVALLIMIVGMVGLLQTIGVALEHNLRNQLREESVYIGEKYMNELRATPFASYPASYPTLPVTSALRGRALVYSVDRSATSLTADGLTKMLQVTVRWTFRKVDFQNRVTATVSQAPP